MSGLFGTEASIASDLSLVVTMVLAIVGAYGGLKARQQQYSRHCPVMAAAALLTWLPAVFVMVPVWLEVVRGSETIAPAQWRVAPVFHGALGLVALLLMTYTVTRMYWLKQLPPEQPVWLMRSTLGLWLLAVIGGVSVYLVAY